MSIKPKNQARVRIQTTADTEAKRKKLTVSKETLRDLAAPDRSARLVRGGWRRSDLNYCY